MIVSSAATEVAAEPFSLQSCIHPVMTNAEANRMLHANGPSLGDGGRFILRKRTQENEYVLSLVFKDKMTVHLLSENADGIWTVGKKSIGPFTSLAEVSVAHTVCLFL